MDNLCNKLNCLHENIIFPNNDRFNKSFINCSSDCINISKYIIEKSLGYIYDDDIFENDPIQEIEIESDNESIIASNFSNISIELKLIRKYIPTNFSKYSKYDTIILYSKDSETFTTESTIDLSDLSLYEKLITLEDIIKHNPYIPYYFVINVNFSVEDDLFIYSYDDYPVKFYRNIQMYSDDNPEDFRVWLYKNWRINHTYLDDEDLYNYSLQSIAIPLIYIPHNPSKLNCVVSEEQIEKPLLLKINNNFICTPADKFHSYLQNQFKMDYVLLPPIVNINIQSNCFDPIMLDEVKSQDFVIENPFNNFIFYINNQGFCYFKDKLLLDLQNLSNLFFECQGFGSRGNRTLLQDVDYTKKEPDFFLLKGLGTFLIPYSQRNIIFQSKAFEFDIISTNKQSLPLHSVDAKINEDLVSAKHCREYDSSTIYTIVPRPLSGESYKIPYNSIKTLLSLNNIYKINVFNIEKISNEFYGFIPLDKNGNSDKSFLAFLSNSIDKDHISEIYSSIDLHFIEEQNDEVDMYIDEEEEMELI